MRPDPSHLELKSSLHYNTRSGVWKGSADGECICEGPADRAVGASVRQLEADIRTCIDRHNENPKPFKWAKSADQILASVKRFCQKTQQTLCGEL
jgi:hypothetical protein